MEDMWQYIHASTPLVNDSDLSVVIHKRHVIGFCTHRCNGIFFDFDKLYRERGVVLGGMWHVAQPMDCPSNEHSSHSAQANRASS